MMSYSTCHARRRLLGRDGGGHALPQKILARGTAVAKITERIVWTAGGIRNNNTHEQPGSNEELGRSTS